jgi:hypothetical protein
MNLYGKTLLTSDWPIDIEDAQAALYASGMLDPNRCDASGSLGVQGDGSLE